MRRHPFTTPAWPGPATAVCLAVLLSLLGTALHAEQPRPTRGPPAQREIVIVNRSPNAIYQVYVSPTDAEQWGDDRLGDDTIEPGGSFRIHLGRTRDCSFDIQVIFADAGREERHGVELCHTRQVSFDGSTAIVPPELAGNEHMVALTNRTNRPIAQVFASPSAADQWGDDRLRGDGQHQDTGPIAVGETRTVTYRGGCVSDLRIVYDNRAAEERRGLDFCAAPNLAISPGWTTQDPPPPDTAPDTAPDAAGTITLDNQSGNAVTEFYLYRADGADRGPDLLGNDILRNGTQLQVAFPPAAVSPTDPSRQCHFSAQALHGGDRPRQDLTGINLCDSRVITIPPP